MRPRKTVANSAIFNGNPQGLLDDTMSIAYLLSAEQSGAMCILGVLQVLSHYGESVSQLHGLANTEITVL